MVILPSGGPNTGETIGIGSILVFCYVWNRVLSPAEFQTVAQDFLEHVRSTS